MLSTQMVTEKNKEVNKRRECLIFLDSLVQFIRIFAYFHYGIKNTLIYLGNIPLEKRQSKYYLNIVNMWFNLSPTPPFLNANYHFWTKNIIKCGKEKVILREESGFKYK